MRALLLFLALLTAAMPALADPPPDEPMPEDVLRPRTEEGIKFFAEAGLGLNYTFMSANPTYRVLTAGEVSDIYESASGLGLLSYSALGVRLSPLLSIVLRGDYDQRSASCSEVSNDTVPGTTQLVPLQKDYDLTINYETLSLLAELNFDDLMVYVGPAVSVGVSSEFNETQTYLPVDGADPYFFDRSGNQTKTVTGHEELKDSLALRFAIKLGVGYQFEVAPKFTVIPRLGYDLGLTSALTDRIFMKASTPGAPVFYPLFVEPDFKLSSVQFTVGIRYTP